MKFNSVSELDFWDMLSRLTGRSYFFCSRVVGDVPGFVENVLIKNMTERVLYWFGCARKPTTIIQVIWSNAYCFDRCTVSKKVVQGWTGCEMNENRSSVYVCGSQANSSSVTHDRLHRS